MPSEVDSNTTGVYLELFHGREGLEEQMDNWGAKGPVLGPFQWVHTTYCADWKIITLDGLDGGGMFVLDMLYYDHVYYGDWSVIAADLVQKTPALLARVQAYDDSKTKLPKCKRSQYPYSSVGDVIARLSRFRRSRLVRLGNTDCLAGQLTLAGDIVTLHPKSAVTASIHTHMVPHDPTLTMPGPPSVPNTEP
jgi:hypothetical protein